MVIHTKNICSNNAKLYIYIYKYIWSTVLIPPSVVYGAEIERERPNPNGKKSYFYKTSKCILIYSFSTPLPLRSPLIPLRYIERINMDSYLTIIVPWTSQFGRSIARLSGGINDIYILRDTGLPPKKFKIYLIGLSRTYYHPIVHIRSTPVFLYIIPK